jgi:hypothetical protein
VTGAFFMLLSLLKVSKADFPAEEYGSYAAAGLYLFALYGGEQYNKYYVKQFLEMQ